MEKRFWYMTRKTVPSLDLLKSSSSAQGNENKILFSFFLYMYIFVYMYVLYDISYIYVYMHLYLWYSAPILPFCQILVWTVTCHHLAQKLIASEHAYLCAHPVIVFSPFQSHLAFVFFLLILGPLSSELLFLRVVFHMAILGNSTRSILLAYCAFDVSLSLPWLPGPAHWLPFVSFLIHLLSCFRFCLFAAVGEDSFPLASNGRCSSSFFPDLHHTTQSFDFSIFFVHCSCSDSNKISYTCTVGSSSSPKNSRSPRPADYKNGRVDITASPSNLLALLVLCSGRSIDHVGDLYPASSFSSVLLVSSWMTVISFCPRSESLS